MFQTQKSLQGLEQNILDTLQRYEAKTGSLSSDLADLKHLLKQGFRLPEEG